MCIRDRLKSQALMAMVALLLAAVAVYFGMRLRSIVTDPILGLAQVSTRVSREQDYSCLLYTSPSPRDRTRSRMPSSA